MTETVLCYVTCSDLPEARRIGEAAVESRLAACANILPGMQTIYRWQGSVEQGSEVVLILKTRRTLAEPLGALVREAHSYECPCFVVLPIAGGNPAYLAWIAQETTVR
jgi:periplasmic divalent cation tolerance protein